MMQIPLIRLASGLVAVAAAGAAFVGATSAQDQAGAVDAEPATASAQDAPAARPATQAPFLLRPRVPPPADVTTAADWRTVAPENLLVVDTPKGRILAELDPRVAPLSVQRIRTLADRGFYDGLTFHRVIPNFMAQTGDPLGTGGGGSDLPDVAAELTFRRGREADFAVVPNVNANVNAIFGSIPIQTQPDAQMFVTADAKVAAQGLFCPGVLGMARSAELDSANSQFFFMTGANPSLNGLYTPFGRVVSGLDVAKALNAGTSANDGRVENPDVMTRVRMASSLPEAERPVVRVMLPSATAFTVRVEYKRLNRGTNFNLCDLEVPAEVVSN